MMFRILFLALISVFSLGQFSSLLSIGEAKVYAFDVFIGIYTVVAVLYLLVVRKSLIISKFFLPFFVFLFLSAISLIVNSYRFSVSELAVSLMYPLRFLTYLCFGVTVHNFMETKVFDVNFIRKAVLWGALLVCIFGFIQLILLPDFTTLDSDLGWDPHKNRLSSAFMDPNFTGGYLFISMFFALWLGKKRSVVIPVTLLAIFLTFSRSTWGALAICVLILGLFRDRKLLILSMLLGMLAFFAVPRVQTRLSGITDPADSASFRLVSWKNALEIAKENPVIGVGFNSYRYSQIESGYLDLGDYDSHSGSGSDSSFLLVLATTGVLGLLVFMLGYLYPVLSAISRKDYFFIALFFGMFLQTQFVNLLFYPQVLFLWMTILGVYSAACSYLKE